MKPTWIILSACLICIIVPSFAFSGDSFGTIQGWDFGNYKFYQYQNHSYPREQYRPPDFRPVFRAYEAGRAARQEQEIRIQELELQRLEAERIKEETEYLRSLRTNKPAYEKPEEIQSFPLPPPPKPVRSLFFFEYDQNGSPVALNFVEDEKDIKETWDAERKATILTGYTRIPLSEQDTITLDSCNTIPKERRLKPDSEDIQKYIQEVYPCVAKTRERIIADFKREQALAYFEANVKPKILEKHPDLDTIMKGEAYWKWAEQQRPALKYAALFSGDADDIIWAISEYKKTIGLNKAK